MSEPQSQFVRFQLQRQQLQEQIARQAQANRLQVRCLLARSNGERSLKAELQRRPQVGKASSAAPPPDTPPPENGPPENGPPQTGPLFSNFDQQTLALVPALVAQCNEFKAVLEDLSARMPQIDTRLEVLRNDLRTMQTAEDGFAHHVKSFDQMFNSLGRDSQKLTSLLDALSVQLREVEYRYENEQALAKDRSEQQLISIHSCEQRLQVLEARFERVAHILEAAPNHAEIEDIHAEQEATASVLASLNKLVEEMRAVQPVH